MLRGVEIYLIRTNTKAADPEQSLGMLQNAAGKASVGAYPHQVGILDGRDQFGFGKRLGMILDIGIAILAESVDGGRMNAFEQQNLDLSLMERGLVQVQVSHVSAVCRRCSSVFAGPSG